MTAQASARITPYRDGPLLVRGTFTLLGASGEVLTPRRETVALCRCGRSKLRPFCDGTHKLSGFSAPAAPADGRPESLDPCPLGEAPGQTAS